MKNVPTNLSKLKSKIDKLDLDELVPVAVDLSKLSGAVKSDVVKKDIFNAKIKKNIEDKIPDLTNLATNTTLNAKLSKVKNKIPKITNLATTIALTSIENKIPNVSNLVKRIDYKIKIKEIENEITTDHGHDKVLLKILIS